MSIKATAGSLPIIGPLIRTISRPFTRHGGVGYAIFTVRNLRGVHPRVCCICNYKGRFRAFGDPPRWDAMCPSCRSLERHRLLALLLDKHPDFTRGRVIHFAPESNVAGLIRPLADQYQSSDLFMRGCDLALDLEKIELPDSSVDAFVASHVLEHVDDAQALDELYRCLKPGGVAIIMVPIIEGWAQTYENSNVSTDQERNLHFGQFDHVRYYGSDLRDRIQAAGFALEEFTAEPEECVRYGLMRGEKVFVARRPLAGTVA